MAAGGEPIVALASKTRSRAEQAARFINGRGELGRSPAGPEKTRPAPLDAGRALLDPPSVPVVDIAQVPQLATRVLIAVSDRAIEPVAEALASAGMRSGAALHTCGARGPDALRALGIKGVACGMLHPLQTIMTPEQGVNSFAEATFGLSGDARGDPMGG